MTDQGAPGTPVICIPAADGEPAENGNGLFMVTCLTRLFDWHDDASGRTVCAILGKLPPSSPALGQTAPDRAWRP